MTEELGVSIYLLVMFVLATVGRVAYVRKWWHPSEHEDEVFLCLIGLLLWPVVIPAVAIFNLFKLWFYIVGRLATPKKQKQPEQETDDPTLREALDEVEELLRETVL